MSLIRFNCSGRVNKPLPAALVDALPVIKANLTDLQTYAVKLNIGKLNEEATNKVEWGTTDTDIWFDILLAIPQPIPQALADKLPAIKDKFRQLKQYAVNTGEASFVGTWHICNHDSGGVCGESQEI